MSQRRPRLQLVLDFDGTVTIEDTTAIIGSRCLAKARELSKADLPLDQLPKPMRYYSEQYMQDYQAWKDSASSTLGERKTVDDEIAYLSQSKDVEKNSYQRVKKAVLRIPAAGTVKFAESETQRNEFMMNAGREAVRGGEVRIRELESLKRLIEKADLHGNIWGIVSVNWSRRFILGVLIEAGLVPKLCSETTIHEIKCNEILEPDRYDDAGEPLLLCSAQDKRQAFNQLLVEWKSPIIRREEYEAMITVYIGDSITDLGCIAGPAIGIYLYDVHNENDPVVQTLERLGIEYLTPDYLPTANVAERLTHMRTMLQDHGRPPHIVCLAKSLEEIDQWLSKVDGYDRARIAEEILQEDDDSDELP